MRYSLEREKSPKHGESRKTYAVLFNIRKPLFRAEFARSQLRFLTKTRWVFKVKLREGGIGTWFSKKNKFFFR